MRCVLAIGLFAWLGTTTAYDHSRSNITIPDAHRSLNIPSKVSPLHEKATLEQPSHATTPTLADKCSTSTQHFKDGKVRHLTGCKSYEYTQFVQTWAPGEWFTYNNYRIAKDANEAHDWNNNLKIHGLWPYNSKLSTLNRGFTPQARKAINKDEWPNTQIEEGRMYDYQWETFGVKSGLNALEYVQEIERLHHLHETPSVLKRRKQESVPLSTLKSGTTFHRDACLVCRSKLKQEYLVEVRYCHKANPKTHRAEEIVPMSFCGGCPKTECSKENIFIAHVPWQS